MPAPITILPDSELAVIQYLKARTEVTSLVPAARITTSLPPNPTYPCITVKRVGGTNVAWQRIDSAAFQIDVWHADGKRGECQDAARAVRACLLAIYNDQVAEATLVSASEEVALQWLPDTVTTPPLSRFTGRFQVLLHP